MGSQSLHQLIHYIILQGVLSILQAKAESKRFFVAFQALAAIFIKQNNGLHNAPLSMGRYGAMEGVEQVLHGNGLFHHQGNVARGAGEF